MQKLLGLFMIVIGLILGVVALASVNAGSFAFTLFWVVPSVGLIIGGMLVTWDAEKRVK